MYTLKRGDRHYESSNHLSNLPAAALANARQAGVLVVFTDKRIAQC